MANPSAQVPTESIPFTEEKVYWPADPTKTTDVTYAGEMMGMRADTGYAEHFDDAAPKVFLGTKEQIVSRFQSDTPAADFKYLIRRPRLYSMPLNTGVTANATIPGNIGSPAYAADSGHVQLSVGSLVNANLAGMVVDISRSYSTASAGGVMSLTTANTTTSVVLAPPTFGALVGLVVQGFVGSDVSSGTGTAGGAASALLITSGRGGNQTVASATANAGAGANLSITLGAGGNASGTSSTGNGGAGGSLVVTCGAGGTTVGGSAGAPGNVTLSAGTDPAAGTPTLKLTVTDTTTGNVTDGYTAALRYTPVVAGANTVTRLNFIDVNQPTGAATITDGCLFRFNAAAGTHKFVDAGTTKTSPGTVTQWLKVNCNGTIAYIPSYSSKTS